MNKKEFTKLVKEDKFFQVRLKPAEKLSNKDIHVANYVAINKLEACCIVDSYRNGYVDFMVQPPDDQLEDQTRCTWDNYWVPCTVAIKDIVSMEAQEPLNWMYIPREYWPKGDAPDLPILEGSKVGLDYDILWHEGDGTFEVGCNEFTVDSAKKIVAFLQDKIQRV